MFHKSPHGLTGICLTAALLVTALGSMSHAQIHSEASSVNDSMQYQIGSQSERVQIVVQSSRVLTFSYDVPKFVVGNNAIIRATPVAPNQIMISGITQGVSPLGVYDKDGAIHTLDIHVTGDVRSLQIALDEHFPNANIKAHALNASVILTGYVPNADMMTQVMRVSEDFFPTPINNMNVGGSQTVLLNVKVVEVSRTKLRQFGIDWALLTGNDFFIQSVNGLIDAAAAQTGNIAGQSTFRFGVINNGNQFAAFFGALEQNNMANILDEPILVTNSGRPASLRSGGQVPIPVANGLGSVTVEFREFGTLLDFVPIVLGDGMLRLEINSDVVEIAGDLRDPITGVPGFRNRGVNTGVTMRAGQTLALAGIIQNRRDAEVSGLPFLIDLPWIGTFFRGVNDTFNEVELVIMVTPQFIGPVEGDASMFDLPGQSTTAPSDVDFFFRGYLEVPRCGDPLELGPVMPAPSGEYFPESGEGYLPNPSLEGGAPQAPADPNNIYYSNFQDQSMIQRPANQNGNFGQGQPSTISRTSYQQSQSNNRAQSERGGAPRSPNFRPRFIGETGYDVIK